MKYVKSTAAFLKRFLQSKFVRDRIFGTEVGKLELTVGDVPHHNHEANAGAAEEEELPSTEEDEVDFNIF